jgi:hypothetical protein
MRTRNDWGQSSMDQAQTLPWVDSNLADDFLKGVHAHQAVSGLTHSFYRYPARFSPLFVRAAIRAFTAPGDVVLDPFMGGATTLVEARSLGRTSVGLDISSLACFIARSKTNLLSNRQLEAVRCWTQVLVKSTDLQCRVTEGTDWEELGYHRNINDRETWRIRKYLQLALQAVSSLDAKETVLARALLLRTAQWALDCRKNVPAMDEFRSQLLLHRDEMISGAQAFRNAVRTSERRAHTGQHPRVLVLHRPAEQLDKIERLRQYCPPRLVLTSPPYPGVHVMYHRWQVKGRKETPAPFWIANTLDGNGLSYYTFGDRGYPELLTYFNAARTAFSSIAKIADRRTLIVQMVAFADPSWQLPAYLNAMADAGLTELRSTELANARDGRLWRTVPNRKWYADQRGIGGASKEVVLFHRRQAR